MKKGLFSLLFCLSFMTSCSQNHDSLFTVYNNALGEDAGAEESTRDGLVLNSNAVSLVDGQTFQIEVLNSLPSETYKYSFAATNNLTVSSTGLISVNIFSPDKYENIAVPSVRINVLVEGKEHISSYIDVKLYTQKQALKNGEIYSYSLNEYENEYIIDNIVDKNIVYFSLPSYIKDANSIDIPVTTISDSAFKDCKNLVSVENFSSSNTSLDSIGDSAFYNCENLKMDISFPSKIKKIPARVFYNCRSISSVDLSTVEEIGSSAFYNCQGIETVSVNKNVTAIYDKTFAKCLSLREVTFLDADQSLLKSIGYSAFSSCTALENVLLPESVTDISAYSFSNTAIETFNIPSSLTSFSSSAFYQDIKLKNFTFNTPSSNFKNDSSGALISADEKTLFLLPSAFDNSTDVIDISSSIEKIMPYCFASYQKEVSVNISSTAIKEISEYAFVDANITSVNLTGVTDNNFSLGKGAFLNCTKLKSFSINDTYTKLEKIEDYLFSGCNSLSTLSINFSSLSEIGDYSFFKCTSLNSTGRDLLKANRFGKHCFEYCDSSTIEAGETPLFGLSTTLGKVGEKISFIGDFAFSSLGENVSFIINSDELSSSSFDKYWNVDNYLYSFA